MHPLQALREWYDSCEADVKSRIAFTISVALPTDDGELSSEVFLEPEKTFENWIGKRGHYIQDVARVVTARALISHLVMRTAESAESWETTRKLFETVLNSERAGDLNDHMVKTAKENLEKMPSKIALWSAASRSWQGLCNAALSDLEIAQWEKQVALEEMKNLSSKLGRP